MGKRGHWPLLLRPARNAGFATLCTFILLWSVACSSASLTGASEATTTAVPTATESPPTPTASLPQTAPRPHTSETILSPQQLQEDLHVLHTTLQEAHPGLYLYTAESTREAQFRELLARLDQPMTEAEFLRLVGPFVTAIRDGHTWVSPSAQSRGASFLGPKVYLPLILKFIEGRAFVDRVLAPEADISRGTEVLEIDGIQMPSLLSRLLPFVSRDGHGETLPYVRLGQQFPVFFAIALYSSDSYEVKTRDPSTGQEATLQLAAVSPVVVEAAITARRARMGSSLDLELLEEEGIAILTIRSFGDTRLLSFLKSSFATIGEQGIQDLIVDLRGNAGGNDQYGALLYSYLVEDEFRYYDRLETILDEPLTYLQHTDRGESEQAAYLKMIESLERTESGAAIYPHGSGLHEPQAPRPESYGGNVYVLVDGGSFSATGAFASIAHHNRRAVFVGEETGATYYGNVSGGFLLLTLPHSRIRVTIPVLRYVMAVSGYPHRDRGLLPDHPVTQPVEDFIAGVDTQMEYTLDLIRQGR